MASVEAVVGAAVERSGAEVEREVYGTADPGEIAAAIDRLCIDEVGAAVVGGRFHESSIGSVTGVDLADGRAVVVKGYRSTWAGPYLPAVRRIQAVLAVAGFPCPEPLAGPVPVLAGLAVVDGLLPDPGSRAATASTMGASARGLAEQIARCRAVDRAGLDPHPLDPELGDLYPVPHHPRFDFASTTDGAQWIDDLTRAARAVTDDPSGELVIAHGDWTARNVRFDEHRVLAAYDWDSLVVAAEPLAVGRAAATWSFLDGAEPAPTVEEVAAYTAHYEVARGRSFTVDERRTVGASVLGVLAYAARCEHALDPAHPDRGRARSRLHADADAFLRLTRTSTG